ncbi:MAG: hypothetical protein NVSMB14_17080 [Isosphaeraceae bacterium]
MVVKSTKIPCDRRHLHVNPKRKREVLIWEDAQAEVGSIVALACASG